MKKLSFTYLQSSRHKKLFVIALDLAQLMSSSMAPLIQYKKLLFIVSHFSYTHLIDYTFNLFFYRPLTDKNYSKFTIQLSTDLQKKLLETSCEQLSLKPSAINCLPHFDARAFLQ